MYFQFHPFLGYWGCLRKVVWGWLPKMMIGLGLINPKPKCVSFGPPNTRGPMETHIFKRCLESPIRYNKKEGTSTLYPLKLWAQIVYRKRVTVCGSQGWLAQWRRMGWPKGDARGSMEMHIFKRCLESPIRYNEKEGTSTLYPLKLWAQIVYRKRVTVCGSQGPKETRAAQRRRASAYMLRRCVSFGPCICMPKNGVIMNFFAGLKVKQ